MQDGARELDFTVNNVAEPTSTDPARSVYVSTDTGTFKSTDGASTWLRVPVRGVIVSFAVDPHNPSVVYPLSRSGLLKSRDGGETWRVVLRSSGRFALDPQHADSRIDKLAVTFERRCDQREHAEERKAPEQPDILDADT
jgi:hypothetical protein